MMQGLQLVSFEVLTGCHQIKVLTGNSFDRSHERLHESLPPLLTTQQRNQNVSYQQDTYLDDHMRYLHILNLLNLLPKALRNT